MNREKLKYLAKVLEAGDKINDVGFDFGTYRDTTGDCGTMGCIAGMALAIDDLLEHAKLSDIATKAAHSLGLNQEQMYDLFAPSCAFGEDAFINPNFVTGAQAATAIRSLLNGNPDYWAHITPASKGGLAEG